MITEKPSITKLLYFLSALSFIGTIVLVIFSWPDMIYRPNYSKVGETFVVGSVLATLLFSVGAALHYLHEITYFSRKGAEVSESNYQLELILKQLEKMSVNIDKSEETKPTVSSAEQGSNSACEETPKRENSSEEQEEEYSGLPIWEIAKMKKAKGE